MLALPIVLLLVLFATQVAARLHAKAELDALATHASRAAAVAPGPIRVDAATAELRALLGRAGPDAGITWSIDEDAVALRIEVAPPTVVDAGLLGPLAEPLVVHSRIRRERWR
ncbi:MAG: hypothetical protein AAGK32_11675 [Actinomycetota bacterium]